MRQQQMYATVMPVYDQYRTFIIKNVLFLVIMQLLWINCYQKHLILVDAFVPFLDGGKDIPTFYKCYYDTQIAKQVSTAVSKAISSGKITTMEINFPPVPNVDEVKFGTPLNQKFGKTIVAPDLKLPGGYTPGSDIARQQIAFANMYWAKKIASTIGFGKSVAVYSAEPVSYDQIKDKGSMTTIGPLSISRLQQQQEKNVAACIVINPGGEETWERLRSVCVKNDRTPFIVLNNAYSTTYGLGNKQRGYEEVYYLKRISKGWIYRAYPGPWNAYLEKPDGKVELLKSYTIKPDLNVVATLVRDESFKRYAINNDRWTPGFGERL